MRDEVERAIELMRSEGDEALPKALDLIQSTIFSFSMKICRQREDAEDAAQETLLKSIAQLPRFDNPKALLVWLYKVAKTRCLMSRRKSKYAPASELSLDNLMPSASDLRHLSTDAKLDPENAAIRGEQARRLREAVQELPPQYRIVLVLRDMEGLDDNEVSEVTGLRPGTVRVRLHRARLFVRKKLMKALHLRAPNPPAQSTAPAPVRPASCRAMFAQLSEYLDERMDDSLCSELEKHFEGCAPCQTFLASLESTIDSLKKVGSEKLDASKAREIRRQVMSQFERATGAAGNRTS